MTGWYIFEGSHGDRMAFRCGCCHLNTVFAEGEKPRVWHCNQWSEYRAPVGLWQKFFADDLPRVKPQAPVVLRRRQTEDELQ
jgi:hypothetical protein